MFAFTSASGALLGWMIALAALSFVVSFGCADRFDLPRGWYGTVLTGVTVAFWAAAMHWVGPGIAESVRWHWVSGVLVAPLVALIPAAGITRMPATRPRAGARLVRALGWDAAIYGTAEGLLLSALPAYLAWQWVNNAGWSSRVVAGLAAVTFSVVVIVVHHLGYPEFRQPRSLMMASVACGLLTIGYLLTGSVWTPIVGHVLMHAAAVVRGNALPPHSDAGGEDSLQPDRHAGLAEVWRSRRAVGP